jgi:two-component system, OmpR family, response regulator ResD
MQRILIADDEEKIRALVKKYALFEGYAVEEAENGLQAVELCKKYDFDLVVLDVMMPVLDGFSACNEIRRAKSTPVLMLTARGEEYDRIHGFELGIDDYVVKPFSPKELMLRISAIIKRSKSAENSAKQEILSFGGLTVNFGARMVFVDDREAVMTPKEYELLFYLVKNKGHALTREQLITEVWGYDYFKDDRTLDTHIKLLRQHLCAYARYIVTLRGVGYRFDAE